MTWTPTDSQRRAERALQLIGAAATGCKVPGFGSTPEYFIFRARVAEIIADAIEDARVDGYHDARQVEHVEPRDWVKDVQVSPNGPDPHPDGAAMMGGHPDAEYNKIVREKVAAAMPLPFKKAKAKRKKAKAKKAAKQASDKHSGDNPQTGD